jgi:hypothetical protein
MFQTAAQIMMNSIFYILQFFYGEVFEKLERFQFHFRIS